MIVRLFFLLLFLFPLATYAAVILQYHHVSDDTPANTSISPHQFERHMQYLKDNNYIVVSLDVIVEAIKQKQPVNDQWVAITFDDAYEDILLNGSPILRKFNYPYALFVNPSTIGNNGFLNWSQIKSLAQDDVMIVNHGYDHASLARVPANVSMKQWLKAQSQLLLDSEKIIKEKTGQHWQYFAYPYGEYTPEVQTWLLNHGFVGFSQQSGAVGTFSDLSILSRFPVSKPYDLIENMHDKLSSLPLNIKLVGKHAQTVVTQGKLSSVEFQVVVDDFEPAKLNCYVSTMGRQQVTWINENTFRLTFNKELPVGRVRSNCTAPSISKPGRF